MQFISLNCSICDSDGLIAFWQTWPTMYSKCSACAELNFPLISQSPVLPGLYGCGIENPKVFYPLQVAANFWSFSQELLVQS